MKMDKFVYLEKEETPQLAQVQLNNKVLNIPFYGSIFIKFFIKFFKLHFNRLFVTEIS